MEKMRKDSKRRLGDKNNRVLKREKGIQWRRGTVMGK